MKAPIRLHDLTLGYERHPAVRHLSGTFEPGSMTAIFGPNGAGKSTLLKGIAGLLRPIQGRIDLGSARRQDIAYLAQQAEIDRSFPLLVLDFVLLGHWPRLGPFRAMNAAMRRQGIDALAAVGMAGSERQPIGSLSAGQFQRVLFARMLLQDASIILLDEPFTAVDARTTADLFEIVLRWHGEARTIIAVLHDVELVRVHFPSTLLLAREAIAWGPTADVIAPAALSRAHTIAASWDDERAHGRRAA